MAIINVHNKKRGITYVYDSFSYWDKELKQPRSKRRLLGRRDPDTGELVPTRKRAAASTATPANADSHTDYATLYRRSRKTIREKDALILALRRELAKARRLLSRQAKGIAKAVETLNVLEQAVEASHG